jgi:predicted SnoaL-like aldol condensation-catalyzing enzyme
MLRMSSRSWRQIEHWDVIQDEATKEQSKSGNPMFGDSFPDRA